MRTEAKASPDRQAAPLIASAKQGRMRPFHCVSAPCATVNLARSRRARLDDFLEQAHRFRRVQ
jgi:hypothetical protein